MPAKVNLGNLRRKVTIQRIDDSPTSDGGTSNTPNTLIVGYASIEPLSAREFWLLKAQQEIATHRIRMLWTPGITAKMRITYYDPAVKKERKFNVTAVIDPGELHRELELTGLEVVE